jgi:hypothetical protein
MKYNVTSSKIIKAPLKKVKAHVEDFKNWPAWSPWSIIEPDHKGGAEGKAGQVGHKMTWDGEVIGSGENIILSNEDKAIHYSIEFFKPFKSKAKTSFLFEEVKGGTKVTWTMDSSMPFFMFFMIPTMRAWIEMDYNRGLTMLQSIMEKGKVQATTTNKGADFLEGFSYVGIKKTSLMENMPIEMKAAFTEITSTLMPKDKGGKHWISVYPKVNMAKKEFTYIAACSDENLGDLPLPEGWVRGNIESKNMFEIHHLGSYKFLGNAWSMGMMILRAMKMKQKGFPFEYYWNSPMNTPDEKLETSIFFPLKD